MWGSTGQVQYMRGKILALGTYLLEKKKLCATFSSGY